MWKVRKENRLREIPLKYFSKKYSFHSKGRLYNIQIDENFFIKSKRQRNEMLSHFFFFFETSSSTGSFI